MGGKKQEGNDVGYNFKKENIKAKKKMKNDFEILYTTIYKV